MFVTIRDWNILGGVIAEDPTLTKKVLFLGRVITFAG
jgi:hypothetical protein